MNITQEQVAGRTLYSVYEGTKCVAVKQTLEQAQAYVAAVASAR